MGGGGKTGAQEKSQRNQAAPEELGLLRAHSPLPGGHPPLCQASSTCLAPALASPNTVHLENSPGVEGGAGAGEGQAERLADPFFHRRASPGPAQAAI